MRKQLRKTSIFRSRRRRFSPLALMGILLPAILVMVAGVSFAMPQVFSSHAAGVQHKKHHKHQNNQQQKHPQQQQMINCTLTVPANPLTAQGLATPYQLGDGCDEANKMQAAFVQGAVIDPAGNISVYNPLVVNQGQQPAAAPVIPTIPAGSTVGIWFGFNGNNLTLQDMNGSLQQGNCVNGTNGSIFGQYSYCNAPAFFQAAIAATAAGKVNPNPANTPLGTGKDGLTCPSVRDFSVVDQDQSDNVTTTYMINGTQQANASDNRLLDVALDGALGCTPLMAPDLAHPGQMTTALPLNELQAAAQQAAPLALVPMGDPMTLVDNTPNAAKTDLYRMGVDQPAVGDTDGGNTVTYCQNLLRIAPQRLVTDAPLTGAANSPDPAAANSLFTFLAQRFQTTFEGPLGTGLQCAAANQGPVQAQKNADGVAISATITVNGQTQCFDNMGNKVAMTVCINNGNGKNQQGQG
ncbi:MAG: hypothetical protein ACJ8DI_11375 [Ktedonobacteraceae bacterium]